MDRLLQMRLWNTVVLMTAISDNSDGPMFFRCDDVDAGLLTNRLFTRPD